MSNVLSREKREQVIALGRLGWSLRRIEQATGVRRETASEYLRSAGIALRRPGGWGRHSPSKPAINPITDSESEDSKPAINLITDSGGAEAKPAINLITGFSPRKSGCGPASSCEPYGELISLELERGRNAMGIWQDLVDSHGFGGGYQSVRRYVLKLRGLRHGADGARSGQREVSAHAVIRFDAGLQPQIGAAANVSFQCSDLGRAAREGVSSPWRHH
jgi:hypothetical protein